jgi:hypothetical protein
MSKNSRIGMAALCLSIALLTGAAASAGVFLRGDGSTAQAVSIRGEHYEYATTGVYRYNAERVVAEGVGWDLFTLCFAVPALLVSLPWLARGSLRGRLFATGLLGYLFYQYLMYAMTWAFGPLFPLFIVIYSASLTGMVWIMSTVPLAGLAKSSSERFPRKGMAMLCFLMAAALVLLWTQRIIAGLRGDWGTAVLAGETTLVVQGLDLGLIVPLSVFTGVMAWRGRPVGYLLCSTLVVKAVAMAAAICAMLLSAWAVEGSLELAPLALFGGAAAAAVALGVRMYRSVLPTEATGPAR